MYGSIIEYYGNLPPRLRDHIKVWFFDDMCHLAPHAENIKQAELNDVTKQFAGIAKAVDNFHFNKGHKGKWCQQNVNPRTVMKQIGMSNCNTPVCEQTFSWLNKFRNIKGMNESHFKLFILYVLDLHNLHIEKKIDVLANPMNPLRNSEIQTLKNDPLSELLADLNIDNDKMDDGKSLDQDSSETEMINEDYMFLPTGEFLCNFCPGKFKRIGNMRNHLSSKHNRVHQLICVCGKDFTDTSRMSRHQKTCKLLNQQK